MIGLNDLFWLVPGVGLIALAVLGLVAWGVREPGVNRRIETDDGGRECIK